MAEFDLTSTAKVLSLVLIVLLSVLLVIAPTFAPEKFALPLQAAGIAACFARGAIVPLLWDMKPYILIEFAIALIYVVCVILKHCKLPVLCIQARTNDSLLVGPTQTPLSFPGLWFFAALISFIGFEGFFFLVVGSSNELGFFGQFHGFLWTLLKSLGLGIVGVIKAVAGMLYGFANAAACKGDQLLNSEEGAERRPVGGPPAGPPVGNRAVGNRVVGGRPAEDRPTGDRPTGDCPVEEPEASPPPPYVSALRSITFTAHEDPIMQYTMVLDDCLIQIGDVCKLV